MLHSDIRAHEAALRTRGGNALITALIVMSLAATVIITSTESGIAGRRQQTKDTQDSLVAAALDLVLARHQREVIDMATNGRPEDFVAWGNNYGVDFVGSVEVRWKVEPSWSTHVLPDTTTEIVENPTPGDATGAPANARENHGSFYLYRISAEARLSSQVEHDAGNDANSQVRVEGRSGDVSAAAVGVRYVVTPNSSALNYLLFYALKGPKADIELSHGPTVQLIGDVYSGGAIYWGSGTATNDWIALKPSNGSTIIGPPVSNPTWTNGAVYPVGSLVALGGEVFQCKAAHTASMITQPGSGSGWKALWQNVTTCRAIGIDGHFRLSKQVMFGAINGFPMNSAPPAGYSSPDSGYSLDSSLQFANEKSSFAAAAAYLYPDIANYPSDVFNATYKGTVINPGRVKDPLATVPLTGSDTLRVVNVSTGSTLTPVYLRGVDEGASPAVGNDSRDRTRVSGTGFLWKSDSMAAAAPGFNKQLRSTDNGAAAEDLVADFVGRPEEAQKLQYYELDGDLTTDEHEYAMPVFVGSDDAHTTDFAQRRTNVAQSIDAIEVPGKYLSKAIGDGSYMGRKSDYTGWKIVDANGSPVTTESSAGVGLVIRERPVPDLTYFTPTSRPSASDPLYMPYCYGHVRTSNWPFTSVDIVPGRRDVSDGLGTYDLSTGSNIGTPYYISNEPIDTYPNRYKNIISSVASQRYDLGGTVNFRSQAAPGSGWSGGTNDWNSIYYRFPYYYQDCWRFIAFGKPTADSSSVNGLSGAYYNDRPSAATAWLGPFGGRPVYTRTDATINFLSGTLVAGATGVGSNYCSVRWTGSVSANYNDNYQFIASNGSATGVRIWVNEKLVLDRWYGYSGDRLSLWVPMVANQWVPIAVEMYTGSSTGAMKLEWQSQSGAESRKVVPTANLKTPASTLGYATRYSMDTFTAVQARIDGFTQSNSGVTNGKAGLMLRANAGLSPVMDGGDPYVALCWSPTRGVFAQIRGERAMSAQGTRGAQFIGGGREGEGGTTNTDATTGELPYASPITTATPNVWRMGRLTPYVTSTTMTGSITQGYQTNPVNTPNPWTTGSFGYDASPGAIPEGTVDRVYLGPVTVRTVKQPQARTVTSINSTWYYRLGDTDASTQVFVPSGTPNDLGQRLYMFADRGGALSNRTMDGIYPTNSRVTLGTNSSFTTGSPAVTGTVIAHTPNGTSAGGWVNWGTPGDVTETKGDATTIWYLTSPDTRPKVMNGATFVRYLTATETAALMQAKTGLTYTVKTAVPAYPTVAAPTYNAGYPAATIPPIPATYPGYTRLSAATTTSITTLTVASSNGIAKGDVLQLGTEQVLVTATPASGVTAVSVSRAYNGTTPAAWTGGTLVSSMRVPMSVFKSSSTASIVNATATTTDLYVYTVGSLAVNDVVQMDLEQMKITAIDTTDINNLKVTVTRAANGTIAAAHNANTMISSPAPIMSKLTAAVTTTGQTTLTVGSTAGIVIGDVLQLVNELVEVSAIPSATQLTVVRGYGYTPTTTYAVNTTLQRTAPRTFSVSRGKTVTFDLNAWISAGCAPAVSWLATHATDIGWYWSGLKQWLPWKSFWGTITPVPAAGSLQPRVFDKSWTAPRTTQPSASEPLLPASPAAGDAAFPTTVEAASAIATGSGRWLDDQPATWVNGRAYATGAVVYLGTSLYTCSQAHTSTTTTMPASGANWQSYWQTSAPWLRIEKVSGTSKVRFFYAVGSSTPAASDWKPVLITPDTANAAAPLPGTATGTDARVLEVDLGRWFKGGRTTLATAIAANAAVVTQTGVSVSVSSAVALNVAVNDIIQINDEMMLVTGVSGSTLTVTRNPRATLMSLPAHAVGAEVVLASYRGGDLQIGLCAQSGSTSSYLDVTASQMKVETSAGNVDATYWDNPGGAVASGQPNDTTRYLCSQYQVFWGPYDITEDFFFTGQDTGARLANEDWIYNAREFWSQSRWWENGLEKDPGYVFPTTTSTLTNREIWAKTNILSLDLRAIQDYLKNKTLQDAIADRVSGVGPAVPTLTGNYTLKDHVTVDGLRIHASRYNRYPWNPSLNGPNPWNPYLPNGRSGSLSTQDLAAISNDAPTYARATQFASLNTNLYTTNHVELSTASSPPATFTPAPATMFSALMPFSLYPSAAYPSIPAGALWHTPSFKPQDFHHAIRIRNGASIDWGFVGGDKFGASKLLFVTPNQLYIQGDLNTTPHTVDDKGTSVSKMTPVAIYCDNATFLSNTWNDYNMRVPGVTASATGVLGAAPFPSLQAGQTTVSPATIATAPMPVANSIAGATTTTYACALLTHNQPTTKSRVLMGECSSFINTMQYLEDWTGKNAVFIGSIVVMDTRRYTDAYLLDATKTAGLGPFGWMVANPISATAWLSTYSTAATIAPWPSSLAANSSYNGVSHTWNGIISAIYGAPNRTLYYNPDFKTKEGTPPQMPFGIKALGVGGWIKILR